ncbi:MAG: metal-dependent hydrolase [Nanoarchaeota archaeon]
MMYKTHLFFAFLVSIILYHFLNLNPVLIVFVLASSFIPDLDHQNSKIGRKFKTTSFLMNKIFSHRGFFHSILLPIIMYFVFAFILDRKDIALAIFLGISSHLFLDLLTVEGISLFAPFSNKRINGFIKTNSLTEKIIFLVILLITVLFLFQDLSFDFFQFFSSFF